MKKKIFIPFSIIVLNTILLLIISEFAIRVATNLKEKKSAYRQTEESLIVPLANLTEYHQRAAVNGGQLIKWQTNSMGFRGNELKKNTGIRIVVYGDSNIQAVFSSLEDTFCFQLEENLNRLAPGKNFEVINAGVQGFGPDQSLIKASQELKDLRPDILLLHLFAENDFGDLIRNRLFDLTNNGEIVATNKNDTPDPAFVHFNNFGKSTGIWAKMVNASQLVSYAKSLTEKVLKSDSKRTYSSSNDLMELLAKEFEVYKNKGPRKFSQFDDTFDLDVIIEPQSEASRTKIGLLKGVLRDFKELTKHNKIKLLTFIQPSVYDMVYYHPFVEIPNYKRDALSTLMSDITKELDIPSYNLFPFFDKNTPERLFFTAFDAHWNDLGQKMAADQVAKFILSATDY